MGIALMKRVLRFIPVLIFFLYSGVLFAQPGKDKVVTVHGKKYYQHIVGKGETVYGVSKDFNLTVGDIVLQNPRAIDGITAGDTLQIPFVVPSSSGNNTTQVQKDSNTNGPFIYHKVEAKETIYSLCKQYGISMSKMDSLNPELNDKGLKIGMTLKIPNRNYTINNVPPGKRDTAKAAQAFKNLVQQQQGNNAPATVVGKLLNRYNVTIMLPFMTQEVDSLKMNRIIEGTQQFPRVAQISTDFYEGARIALDSLSMTGLNIKLNVYNIPSDSADNKIDSILKLPELASSNLIIGPLYPSHFKRVAKYAAKHQIPIVSPLSDDASVIRENTYTSKAIPSSTTEIEQMADYIAMHYHYTNIILMHSLDAVNDNYYDLFKKRITTTLSMVEPRTDSLSIVSYSDELNDLGKKMRDARNNVIVVPYQGASFVTKLVNQLSNSKYAEKDSVEIYGMHNWTTMDVLSPINLDTLHFHYPSNEYLDYTNHAVNRFVQKFRYIYYSDPSNYACQGFDVTYYYMTMLKKYGTALQDNLMNDKYSGVHTSFDFYRPDPTGGLENKAIYMLEYRNYNLVKDAK
jgi:LysM repeat protein/ABC-type branched-subunit amino acid transport system substrate-binding protein